MTAKVKQGWVNLDVEVTGAEGFTAANVRVVSQGTVAYIPSSWMVRSVDGDTLKVKQLGKKDSTLHRAYGIKLP